MRKLFGAAALAGFLASSVAFADEVKGVIGEIGEGDRGPVVTIDGQDYVAQATAQDALKELKAGDEVSAEYTQSDGVHWLSLISKVE